MARIDCDPFDEREFRKFQLETGAEDHPSWCDDCWEQWLAELGELEQITLAEERGDNSWKDE